MCRIAKDFLVTEAERKHVRRRAQFQQHRDASCHQVFFPAWQGAEGNSCYGFFFLPVRAKILSADTRIGSVDFAPYNNSSTQNQPPSLHV
jgi:hypothetical protein